VPGGGPEDEGVKVDQPPQRGRELHHALRAHVVVAVPRPPLARPSPLPMQCKKQLSVTSIENARRQVEAQQPLRLTWMSCQNEHLVSCSGPPQARANM
jgi:hypothetical protein